MRDFEQQHLLHLSTVEFESLVHQILLAKYPGADIKRSEGSGGDEGIDSFSGLLDIGPSVWQDKHFTGRIRDSQKRQIAQSIRTAFKNRTPARWTLCIPINLTTAEHRWFQSKIVNAYGGPERIKLMQGSDIFGELINNRPLRDAFFPENSISNALRLSQLATKTEHLTPEESGALAVEHAQQYLQEKIDLDPRLRAVLSIGGDPNVRQPLPQRGLVLSVIEGERTTHFLARDVDEFNRDPINFTLETRRDHRSDLKDALDKGLPFTVPAGELQQITSPSPLLRSFFDSKDPAHFQVDVQPILPGHLAAKVLPLRLIAGTGQEAREIAYLPFKVTQMGRREVTFASSGSLPLEVTLKVRAPEKGCTFSVRPKVLGAEVQSLMRIFEFLHALETSGILEIASLEPAGSLAILSGKFSNSLSIPSGFKQIVEDAAQVAAFFRTQIHVPPKYYKGDLDNLGTLKAIATGEPFSDVDINGYLIKDSAHDRILEILDGLPRSIRVEHSAGWRVFRVFDQTIDPGPVIFEAQNATPISPEKIREAYLLERDGNSVEWSMHCNGPCRYTLDASARHRDGGPPSTFLVDV